MKRLKELREEKGLSQAQLGKEIGYSQKAVGHYETGRSEPNLETVKALCRFFGVSADYLLGLKDE